MLRGDWGCSRSLNILGLGLCALGAAVLSLSTVARGAAAQQAPPPQVEHVLAPSALLRPSRPLTWLQAPLPPNLDQVVADRAAAIQLGKAFFWDTQVGSDGRQACASCHFQAGADGRLSNSLSPSDTKVTRTFQTGGPNEQLTASDFPFRRLADPDNRDSAVLRDRHEVVGSQGVVARTYAGPGSDAVDQCTDVADPIYAIHGTNVRQVTARQAPSVLNAIFYGRVFWDGRADTYFNGVNSIGIGDPSARIWKLVDDQLQPVKIVFPSAGLASQATAPGLNEVEMSCSGRTWADVGRKLFHLTPLGNQLVDSSDGALGLMANSQTDPSAAGLNLGYADLIRKAFRSEYWSATTPVSIGGQDYSHMEANFALYWGLSIELYESTLITDQTPYDQYLAGDDTALAAEQYQGLLLFNGKAGCMNCHSGAQLTNNAGTQSGAIPGFSGFENTGVRPLGDDAGAGPVASTNTGATLLQGAFKTPQLRNVELTGPYFHNGGLATLRDVVDFYARGGDFDSTFLDSVLKRQAELSKEDRLNEEQKHALISFLLALTDERVRYNRAPFDHPALCVASGQSVPESGPATDSILCMPALGASGSSLPQRSFLGLDPYLSSTAQQIPADQAGVGR